MSPILDSSTILNSRPDSRQSSGTSKQFGSFSEMVDDLKTIDIRSEVLPIDADGWKALFRNPFVLGVVGVGSVPLSFTILDDTTHTITAVAILVAVLWGFFLNHSIVRAPRDWKLLIGSLFATGIVGISFLLGVHELLPESFMNLPFSGSPVASLLGFVLNVGVLEELCKALPVIAYFVYMQRRANPATGVLVGVFSGLGFAAFENVHYAEQAVIGALQLTEAYGAEGLVAGVQSAIITALLRAICCSFLHAIWSGSVASFVSTAFVRQARLGGPLVVGIAAVAVLHGAYDWFCGFGFGLDVATSAVSFGLFYTYMQRLHRLTATTEVRCNRDPGT